MANPPHERVFLLVVDGYQLRTTHHDFGGRAVPALEVLPGSEKECEMTSEHCAEDRHGHGTHIAGVVGGRRYGVAKAVTLHSVKILDDAGHGQISSLLAALDWVIAKAERPAVLVVAAEAEGRLSSVQYAIEAAQQAGLTMVSAAGNDGGTEKTDACGHTPAFVASSITVGATTRSDQRSNFSNTGVCIDIMAPGSDIKTCGVSSDVSEATLNSTSLAAAHAAGAVALLLAEQPDLKPAEVSQMLIAMSTYGHLSDLRGSPDRLLNSLGNGPQIPWWGNQGMWSLVNGGVNQECGGVGKNRSLHYDFEVYHPVHSLEDCRKKCEDSAETTGCAGISYSLGELRCEVWVQLVRSSVQMTGYLCLRHEAPTTTATQTTTITKTTHTSTSMTTTTITTITSTSQTTTVTSTSATFSTLTTTTSTLLSSSWRSKPNTNCYLGAGASLVNGKDNIGVLPLETCLRKCKAEPECEAVIFQKFNFVGNCWLRSNVQPSACTVVPGFEFWSGKAALFLTD